MKPRTWLFALVLLAMVLSPLTVVAQEKPLTIASSMPDLAFPFFVHMQAQIRAEAAAQGNIELIELDGQDKVEKQTADVEAAIAKGVDALIISPKQVDAMAPAVQEAVDAGVAVVTIDRRIEGVDGILAHVGADNVRGGEIQAEWVVQNYPDGARVFVLLGTPGAGPAIDRAAGVHNVLDPLKDKYPIVFEQTANFRRDDGLKVTEAGLAGLDEPPDVIIAANDDMALGALEAVKALGLEDQIAVIGFDALPEAIASVRDGGLAGTIEQHPGGQSRTAVQIVVNYLRKGEKPESPVILLEPVMITKDNLNEAERIGEVEPVEEAKPLTIASSMPDLAFPFFVHMQAQIRAEAAAQGNIELIELDGQDKVEKQTADVEAAIAKGVDALIISPKQVDAMAPAVQEAVDAGVAVVTIDRRIEGVDGILAHVGADNVRGGEIQAEWVVQNYPDGARVFVLLGTPGAGPAIDRAAGVHNVLDPLKDKYPIVFEQTANFRRDDGLKVTEAGLAGLDEPPDVIIAANDDMALGALEAVKALGLEDQIAVIGFDALPEAIASVRDGGLAGTIEQHPGGQSRTAVQIVVNYLRKGEKPESPVILLEPVMITKDNLNEAERIGEVQ
ncbi:MAG: substrate-binding domain-containing protein [Aggregatilineaceae bacterium]